MANSRLDFTVTGEAVNVASRVNILSIVGKKILFSVSSPIRVLKMRCLPAARGGRQFPGPFSGDVDGLEGTVLAAITGLKSSLT